MQPESMVCTQKMLKWAWAEIKIVSAVCSGLKDKQTRSHLAEMAFSCSECFPPSSSLWNHSETQHREHIHTFPCEIGFLLTSEARIILSGMLDGWAGSLSFIPL